MAMLDDLPTELITKIFGECTDIKSVVNLAATCRRFHEIFTGAQLLPIIDDVLETEFGPLYDASKVIAYKLPRLVIHPYLQHQTMALARQIVRVGRVVQKWEAIYPIIRWRNDSENRRLLRPHEKYRLRQALYRIWLYDLAFHGDHFLRRFHNNPVAGTRDRRLDYMRSFDAAEVVEMAEVDDVVHEMILNDLCPSNSMVQRRFNQGFPDGGLLHFDNYEGHPALVDLSHLLNQKVSMKGLPGKLVREAWGSDDFHRRISEVVLKLDPQQLLYFRDNLTNRTERLQYLDSRPALWLQQPSTLGSAIEAVMRENGYSHGVVPFATGILDLEVNMEAQ